jgi:endonuclease/exonuclease/phosphatase family metal-dependent hydrolase
MKQFISALIASWILVFPLSAQDIKILSYNILHGERPDQPLMPNLEDIAQLLIQMQPEVIALQEVDSMTTRSARIYGEPIDYVQKLGQMVGFMSYFGKAMDYQNGGYGEGILVKKGSDFQTTKLPSPAGGEARAIAWTKVELDTSGEFYFGATHLCHQFEVNRVAQVDSILSVADKFNRPVIWVGDLNFPPGSPEYTQIPAHWKEAGAVAGNPQNTYGTAQTGNRIDYIWYDSRKFELLEYKVLDQITHSDHYPVWAVLRLKDLKDE